MSLTYAERARRRAAVDAHVAACGHVCPGWRRRPHPSTDLTADHITPLSAGGREDGPLRVLCRSCNSRRRGGRRDPVVLPPAPEYPHPFSGVR